MGLPVAAAHRVTAQAAPGVVVQAVVPAVVPAVVAAAVEAAAAVAAPPGKRLVPVRWPP